MLPRQGKVSLLDICCGKGGDISKWSRKEFGLGHYVAADIAEESV